MSLPIPCPITPSPAVRRGSCGQNGSSGHCRATNSTASSASRKGRLPTPVTHPGERQPRKGDVDRIDVLERARLHVHRKAGFIDLDPVGPRRAELPQEFLVGRDERRPEVERILPRVLGLAEQEERDGTQDDRPGRNAECLRLGKLPERLGCVERELLARLELGDKVVIIRVEPLGHLERRDAGPLPLVGHAPGHREVAVETIRDAPESAGPDADHQGRVEDVVVEREVVAWDLREAKALLELPVGFAERARGRKQLPGVGLLRPEPFQRLLQLAIRAQPRETAIRCDCHA